MRLVTVGNMFPPHHLGGYEAVWAQAVTFLREHEGHRVTVLTSDVRLARDAPPDPPHVHRTLRWYWEDHDFPRRSRLGIARIERAATRALDAALEDADAVLWWAMGGLPMSLLARPAARGLPSGAVVHDLWPLYGPRVDPHARRLAAGRAGGPRLDLVDAWSFNSAFVRDAVLDACPAIAPGACRVDPPGIDPGRFADVPAAGPDFGWRLACVGRIDERKGLADAIGALALLPDGATLTVAGGGDEGHLDRLRTQVAELGLGDRVTFLGPVDDVAAVLAAADIALFPVTWEEPFGLVPLEAMAARRPLVATATGGAAEFLADEDNALLVAPHAPHEIAAAVRRLAEDRALRERLVAGGHRTAAAHTQAGFVAAIARFAEDVVSGAGRAGRAGR